MHSIGGHLRVGARSGVAASTLLTLATMAAVMPLWSPTEGPRAGREVASMRMAAAMAAAFDLLTVDASAALMAAVRGGGRTSTCAASVSSCPVDVDRVRADAGVDLRHLNLPPPARG